MTTHLTTHVLDAATGSPAVGVGVVLTAASGESFVAEAPGTVLAHGETDADGRLALGPETLPTGDYALTFLTGEYFAAREVPTFYPFVTVNFTIDSSDDAGDDGATDSVPRHYHVPLLLSPFAYSTYRGS